MNTYNTAKRTIEIEEGIKPRVSTSMVFLQALPPDSSPVRILMIQTIITQCLWKLIVDFFERIWGVGQALSSWILFKFPAN